MVVESFADSLSIHQKTMTKFITGALTGIILSGATMVGATTLAPKITTSTLNYFPNGYPNGPVVKLNIRAFLRDGIVYLQTPDTEKPIKIYGQVQLPSAQ